MKLVFVALLIVLAAGITGCCAKKCESTAVEGRKPVEVKQPQPPVRDNRTPPAAGGMIIGTVKYSNLEGGFYGLVSDGGGTYDPVNLPAEFKKDGLRVRFQIKEKPGMVGIHMRGRIVEVVKVEKLD